MSNQGMPKLPGGDEQTFSDLGNGQYKWDRDFPTENIFTALAGISVVSLIIMIILAIQGIHPWTYPLLNLLGTILFITLRMKVDQYYIFDTFQNQLLVRHKILFSDRTAFVADYMDILGITIQSKFQQSKYRSWWEYFPVIVYRSGKLVNLHPSMASDRTWVESAAKEMAAKVRVDFISPPPESLLGKQPGDLNNEGDLVWISQRDYRSKNTLIIFLIVFGVFIAMGIFMFIMVSMF